MRKIVSIISCTALLLFLFCSVNDKNITFEIKEAEVINEQISILTGIYEVNNIVDVIGEEIIYWNYGDENQLNIYSYNTGTEKNNIIYSDASLFTVDFIKCMSDSIIYSGTEILESGELYFKIRQIGKDGDRILYEDYCERIPYIDVCGAGKLLINYQKTKADSLDSIIGFYNIADSEFTYIDEENLYVDEQFGYSGDFIVYAGGFNDIIYYQKLKLSDCPSIETAQKAYIYEYCGKTGQNNLLLESDQVLRYINGNNDYIIGSDYFFDIPDDDKNVSWIADKQTMKKFDLPYTYVSHEIQYVEKVHSNCLIGYNFFNGYTIYCDDKKILVWDYPNAEKSFHTSICYNSEKYYMIYQENDIYYLYEWSVKEVKDE